MELTTKKTRRQFIGKLALGATAATAGLSMFSNPANAMKSFDKKILNGADEWLKSNLKGSHKVAIDGSAPHDALPLIWTWVYYYSNNETNVSDKDMTALCVLRHSAIPFAFEDRLWDKYNLGEFFGIKDNTTKSPSKRNPYYEPKEGDFPSPFIDGTKKMQERGAIYAVCGMAIMVYSGHVAKQLGADAEEVKKDWMSGILPGIQVVPSGVWALTRAQEYGSTYIYAGG